MLRRHIRRYNTAPEETPKTTSKEKTKPPQVANSKRPIEDSDSEEGTKRGKWKRAKGKPSMADAMLAESKTIDSRLREQYAMDMEERQQQYEERRQQFELEKQQREQDDEAHMAQQQVQINQSAESFV